MPDPTVLEGYRVGESHLADLLSGLNDHFRAQAGRDQQIGHAFFLDGGSPLATANHVATVVRNDLMPRFGVRVRRLQHPRLVPRAGDCRRGASCAARSLGRRAGQRSVRGTADRNRGPAMTPERRVIEVVEYETRIIESVRLSERDRRLVETPQLASRLQLRPLDRDRLEIRADCYVESLPWTLSTFVSCPNSWVGIWQCFVWPSTWQKWSAHAMSTRCAPSTQGESISVTS